MLVEPSDAPMSGTLDVRLLQDKRREDRVADVARLARPVGQRADPPAAEQRVVGPQEAVPSALRSAGAGLAERVVLADLEQAEAERRAGGGRREERVAV